MNHKKYIQLALIKSKQSLESGAFPAGAIIVANDGAIVSQEISAIYPSINLHSESKAIDKAMQKLNMQLSDCTLYCSMQPCAMCLSRAYWAGIRNIFYAVSARRVDPVLCYESNIDTLELASHFHEKINLTQLTEFEEQGLQLYQSWKEKLS